MDVSAGPFAVRDYFPPVVTLENNPSVLRGRSRRETEEKKKERAKKSRIFQGVIFYHRNFNNEENPIVSKNGGSPAKNQREDVREEVLSIDTKLSKNGEEKK